MIRFLFTRSNLVGSRAIRQALNEDCSHFAFEHNGQVIESRIEAGVKERPLAEFTKVNYVVHSLTLREPNKEFEKRLTESIIEHGQGYPYDAKAICFWAAMILAKRWFNRPLPSSNQWGTMGAHTCVEILRGSERLAGEYLLVDLLSRELEMTSPHMLYKILRKSPFLREE